MQKLFQIVAYRNENDKTGSISGPYRTPEAAERALSALFQSGRAASGNIREVAAEDDDTPDDDSDNAA